MAGPHKQRTAVSFLMKTFIVLGMHRSATSLVAKSLHHEISMGERLLPAIPNDNPLGYYEDIEFIQLNDKILRKAGGDWRNPPSEEKILQVADRFDSRIRSILQERYSYGVNWGWKDPRTVLTIRLYLPYLINPHFISCLRDPQEVAASLVRRDSIFFTQEKAVALANEYNQRLLKFLADFAGI